MKKNTAAYLGILFIAIVGSMAILLGVNLFTSKALDASEACASSFSQPQTLQNRCVLHVKEGASEVAIQSTVEIEQGEVRWTLHDPKGEVTWQSSATANYKAVNTQNIPAPAPGAWTLVINADRAQGRYLFAAQNR